jgi:hypothetical protein
MVSLGTPVRFTTLLIFIFSPTAIMDNGQWIFRLHCATPAS